MVLNNETGNLCKLVRHELRLSQYDLSVILGVARPTISYWETGKHPPPPYLLPYLLCLLDNDILMAAIMRRDNETIIESFEEKRTCGHCGTSTRKYRGFRS